VFEHLNFIVNFQNADYSDLRFPEADKRILRELALQVAEVAHRPVMEERKELWKNHNALRETRPLLLCDPENGWNEIITDNQVQCANSIARHWEVDLRKRLFWGNQMGDDYVVEPVFNSIHIYKEPSWGIEGLEKQATVFHAMQDGGAYHIETILEDFEAQFDKIEEPEISIDRPLTEKVHAIARDLFDDILTTRLNTWWFWSTGPTDEYVRLRGMENMMLDFYDEPEYVHKTMQLIQNWTIRRLEFFEKNDLLTLNNDGSYVGSGSQGFTDELPASDFNGTVRIKDMWGLSESQVSVGVSNPMFEEFIFRYQQPVMERFGLSCYGCCEPMHERIDIVRRTKNLRRVSVSPWADKEIMAQKLGRDFIYSAKPNPSFLTLEHIDEEASRKEVRHILDVARDSCLELVMKDNHTLGRNPNNIKDFVKIAREEISRAGF
jgi:hypothetical protein